MEGGVIANDDVRSQLVGIGVALGAGVGLTFGVILGGGPGIAIGMVFGAAVGAVIGAALSARRPPDDK